MGKSSAQAPGDTTQRQTNLPEYADPYFRRLLQGAEDTLAPFQDDLSSPIYDDAGNITGFGQKSTYQPYSGERLTSSSDYGDIQASRAMTRGIAQSGIQGMPEAMDAQREAMDLSRFGVGLQDEAANAQRLGMAEAITGAGYTEDSINRLRDIGQYAPGTFSSFDPTQFGGFQSSDFDPYSRFRQANYNEYDFQQPDMFTGQAVQNYMSPYMQNVVDVQKQQAQLDFDRQQAGRDASAVQAGAFGGSRQAVGDYLAQEGLSRQMGDIQASGQQQAYQQEIARRAAHQVAAQNQQAQAQAQSQQAPDPRPEAKDWAEKNQWFMKEGHEEMTALAYGAHTSAIQQGMDSSSSEYFDYIDNRMRTSFPEYDWQDERTNGRTATATANQRPSSVVAPSSRSNGAKSRKVQLSSTAVALAKRLGLTPEQYANQLIKERK